jgi:hypothetical protein
LRGKAAALNKVVGNNNNIFTSISYYTIQQSIYLLKVVSHFFPKDPNQLVMPSRTDERGSGGTDGGAPAS